MEKILLPDQNESKGTCLERCPFAQNNPEAIGVDNCTGESLRIAERFKGTEREDRVHPICKVIGRAVTWNGEVIDVPPLDPACELVRESNPTRWMDLFNAEVLTSTAAMADNIRRLDACEEREVDGTDMLRGFDPAVAQELKSMLSIPLALGLTVPEAAEYHLRTYGGGAVYKATRALILEQMAQESSEE